MTQTHTKGPYWVRINTNGSHDVCGRNAKIIRSYPAHMAAAADQDCRRLQKGYSADDKALTVAAVNSYDKHCGSNAIACAGGDLLGEALAAIGRMIPSNVCLTNSNVPDSTILPMDVTMGELRALSAVLLKAKGEA